VIFRSAISNSIRVTSGVTQSSKLGRSFFNHLVLAYCGVLMYSDDVKD